MAAQSSELKKFKISGTELKFNKISTLLTYNIVLPIKIKNIGANFVQIQKVLVNNLFFNSIEF